MTATASSTAGAIKLGAECLDVTKLPERSYYLSAIEDSGGKYGKADKKMHSDFATGYVALCAPGRALLIGKGKQTRGYMFDTATLGFNSIFNSIDGYRIQTSSLRFKKELSPKSEFTLEGLPIGTIFRDRRGGEWRIVSNRRDESANPFNVEALNDEAKDTVKKQSTILTNDIAAADKKLGICRQKLCTIYPVYTSIAVPDIDPTTGKVLAYAQWHGTGMRPAANGPISSYSGLDAILNEWV